MSTYVFVYSGGSGMPESEEEGAKVMAAWGAWMQDVGSALKDAGNPFGPSSTVGADGSISSGGTSGLTGYSILTADSLDAANGLAKSCPVLASGGTVEVYETFDVM